MELQRSSVLSYLNCDLKCRKQTVYSNSALQIYDAINEDILHNQLPDSNDVMFWSEHGDFQTHVFGKTFISDPARPPPCLFAIVLSTTLITDELTLLSVILHEICHGILHLEGSCDTNHGKSFTKIVKSTVKAIKRNADHVRKLEAILKTKIDEKLLQRKLLNNVY